MPVVARGMAYISGQIGLRPDGTVPDTVREQIEWAFKRAEAILRRLGLDFSDVVEMVSYHVDVGAQLSDFREVKSRYMRADFPAWTILGVAELAPGAGGGNQAGRRHARLSVASPPASARR
ncbi:Rid family hydrolase [Achromobacter xylosoxidans]